MPFIFYNVYFVIIIDTKGGIHNNLVFDLTNLYRISSKDTTRMYLVTLL